MKYRIVLLLLAALRIAGAQSFSEVGITLGGTGYQGDLVEPAYRLARTRPAVGVQARTMVASHWGVSAGLLYGGISASDLDYPVPYRQSRALELEARLLELAVSLEYHFFDRATRVTRYGVFDRFWSPYLAVGVGSVYVERRLSTPQDVSNPEAAAAPSLFWVVPVRVGCRYEWSPRMAVIVEAGARPTFSDHFDGVLQQGRSDTNDWYWHGAVGFHLVLGGREKE